MNPIEVLIFRNFSSFNEPALSFGFGYMSFRNLIVVGVFFCISMILYKLILPTNIELERDIILITTVLFPVSLGMILAMIKPQIGTADSILFSMLYLTLTKNKKNEIKRKSKKQPKTKSTVLKFANKIKNDKIPDSDVLKIVTCADFDELKSFFIKLRRGDGEVLSNEFLKCYLDDQLIDSITTSLDGNIELKIQPKSAGKKLLVIKDKHDKVIHKKTILFKRK